LPDSKTIEVYTERAEEFATLYNSVPPPFLSRVVEAAKGGGKRLIDIGCGSGRDLAAFLDEGFEVLGVEPSEALIRESESAYPCLKGTINKGFLPDHLPASLGKFDVVHCSAVLMHLAPEELLNSIFTLRDLLVSEGILHISFQTTRPGLDASGRVEDGRIYYPIDCERLKALFRRAGLELLSEETSKDGLGRKELEWVSIIMRRQNALTGRPLQRIEQIVNHDSKVATYKLALLRALADLAETHFHEAQWLGEGFIGVPSDLIVDKWIRYYWPIIENKEFIAQNNGEEPGCPKPLKFRAGMEKLINQFRDCGSYQAFLEEDKGSNKIALAVRRKIRDALRDGPVKYASGNVFSWKRMDRQSFVMMPASFWEEIAELSRWIEPAIRLQWAEESRRFSKEKFETGQLLNILSTDYDRGRSVITARALFMAQKDLQCTWTGKDLKRDFDVDHIIPFSIWRNNDLWNLVPADSKVNNQKRDKLVARELLMKRRDAIVHAWEVQNSQLGDRFKRELANLIGHPPDPRNWKSPGFNRLAEAIEATALRRQAARWSA
jgi:SAM-dependent methyltransferase